MKIENMKMKYYNRTNNSIENGKVYCNVCLHLNECFCAVFAHTTECKLRNGFIYYLRVCFFCSTFIIPH